MLNAIPTSVSFLYPPKTPENLWFFGVSVGVYNGNIGKKWVKISLS